MNDKPKKDSESGSSYDTPASPYDQPTEQFSSGNSKSVPRTDDELTYGNGSSTSAPTETMPAYDNTSGRSTDAVRNTDSVRDTDTSGHVATPVAVHPNDVETIPEKRGTTGLGLLVLRLAVGGIILVHGLQKLIGLFNGPGLDGFEGLLISSGFDQTSLLALLGAIGEVAGGGLLILGLATPFAAASVVAVMINAWCVVQVAEPGLQFFNPGGVEYESLLLAAAVAIALTGPGRIALDGGRKFSRRPFIGSTIILLLGIAAGVLVWIFLNGSNPFA